MIKEKFLHLPFSQTAFLFQQLRVYLSLGFGQ